ncbi:hypothetical protein C8Q76DRAFT_790434 [Earliella scabrosa]|nr:hypothetical protein C8Q76DRAFT_790434 [Earliella scabrosa]
MGPPLYSTRPKRPSSSLRDCADASFTELGLAIHVPRSGPIENHPVFDVSFSYSHDSDRAMRALENPTPSPPMSPPSSRAGRYVHDTVGSPHAPVDDPRHNLSSIRYNEYDFVRMLSPHGCDPEVLARFWEIWGVPNSSYHSRPIAPQAQPPPQPPLDPDPQHTLAHLSGAMTGAGDASQPQQLLSRPPERRSHIRPEFPTSSHLDLISTHLSSETHRVTESSSEGAELDTPPAGPPSPTSAWEYRLQEID